MEEPFLWCLLFAPVDPYWYLIVLFCYYVFFAFLGILGVRFGENGGEKNHKRMLLAGAVISGFAPAVLTFFSERPALFLYRLVYHFVFFVSGIFVIRNKDVLKERLPGLFRVLLPEIILLAAVFYNDKVLDFPFVRETAAFGIVIGILSWAWNDRGSEGRVVLNWLGKNSLYIYLTHNYVTVLFRMFYKRMGIVLPGAIYIVFSLIASLLVCSFVCLMANRLWMLDIFFRPVKTMDKMLKGRHRRIE